MQDRPVFDSDTDESVLLPDDDPAMIAGMERRRLLEGADVPEIDGRC
jgi:hypothetical protein